VTSLFETAADNIYVQNNSIVYKDSIIYSIGSFNGSITSNGTQLQTNYSRGIYLLKTTLNNEFVWLKKIAENDFLILEEPVLAIDVDSLGNLLAGIGFRDKLVYSGDSTVIDDGGYNKGIVLLKLDNETNLIWSKFIKAYWLGKNGVKVEKNNDILITGTDYHDFFLAKYSSQGDSLWTRTGGASNSNVPVGGNIIALDEMNNYYCSGVLTTGNNIYFDQIHPIFSPLNFGKYGSFLAKYNEFGDIQWLKCLFPSAEQIQFAPIISLVVKDGKVLVAGKYNSSYLHSSPNEGSMGQNNSTGNYRSFLIQYDTTGDRLWSKITHINANGENELMAATIGINGAIYTATRFVAQLSVNGSMLSGGSFGQVILERYSPNGDLLNYILIEGSSFEYIRNMFSVEDDLFLMGTTNSNPLMFDGITASFSQNPTFFIAKLHDNLLSTPEQELNSFSVFPNPTSGKVQLISKESLQGQEVRVYNSVGQSLLRQKMEHPFSNEIQLPEINGVYFLNVGGQMKKVFKQ